MISEYQLTKFQELHRKRWGVEISRKEALEKGSKLLRLMQLIYVPMTEKDYQIVQERRQAEKSR